MPIERTYNVPLRKEWLKAPRYKRAKKAITALRKFLVRHMKSENISIGKNLNEEIWKHGMRNPPHHVKINVLKEDDGKVYAELIGYPLKPEAKPEEKKEEKKEEKPKEIEEREKRLEEKREEIKKEKEEEAKKKEKIIEQLEEKKEKAEKKARGKPKEKFIKGRGVRGEEKRKKERVVSK